MILSNKNDSYGIINEMMTEKESCKDNHKKASIKVPQWIAK